MHCCRCRSYLEQPESGVLLTGGSLAVLVDRGGRQLPVQADFAAARLALAPTQSLALARDAAGNFQFDVQATEA